MKKVFKWLDNYWYHYKWQTIIAAFFIFAGSFLLITTLNRTSPDLLVMYGGPRELSADEMLAVNTALASLTDDANGDGKVTAELSAVLLLTDEQLTAMREEALEADALPAYDPAILAANRTGFVTTFFASDAVICLADPSEYRTLLEGGVLVALSEIFGDGGVPGYASEEYGVLLADTPLAKEAAMSIFPSDTVLCIRRMSELNAGYSAAEAEYERQKAVFRDICE